MCLPLLSDRLVSTRPHQKKGFVCLPLPHWHACEGVAMPVRVCSWKQTAVKVTAAPPASPGQAGFATPVVKQSTRLWLDRLNDSCRVRYCLLPTSGKMSTHADFTVFTESGRSLNHKGGKVRGDSITCQSLQTKPGTGPTDSTLPPTTAQHGSLESDVAKEISCAAVSGTDSATTPNDIAMRKISHPFARYTCVCTLCSRRCNSNRCAHHYF